MNIIVVLRQVPDLIEQLELDADGKSLDWGAASYIINESDDHALEQALLLKEAGGGTVTVVGLDFGNIEGSLHTAAAKGADRLIRLAWGEDAPPRLSHAAALYAAAIKPQNPDLVLVGVQAHDEWEGVLAPWLAATLGLPYVGVIRGVWRTETPGKVRVHKEFPGAVMAEFTMKLPAVLGILGAEKPPRYVPVSRIRAAAKSAQIVDQNVGVQPPAVGAQIEQLYFPAKGEGATMLTGSAEEVAARIAELLAERGLLR